MQIQEDLLDKQNGMFDIYWKQIIRPPRLTYTYFDLGPITQIINNRLVRRQDFEFTNQRNHKLVASLYEVKNIKVKPQICVVYLHGNSSCRLEGISNLEIIVSLNLSLCVFDFSGCGNSEGNTVSLGFYEKDDTITLLENLKKNFGYDEFILWGRSMGASTSVLVASQYPFVKAVLVDSAYISLKKLLEEIGEKQFKLLKFLIGLGISYIRKKVIQFGKFDIYDIQPLETLKNSPRSSKDYTFFFISGQNDELIHYSHTQQLFSAFQGRKHIHIFKGDHNSIRPYHVMLQINDFFEKITGPIETPGSIQAQIHKKSLQPSYQLQQQQEETIVEQTISQQLI